MELMNTKYALAFVLLFSALGFAQAQKTPLRPPAQPNLQLYPVNANATDEIREAVTSAKPRKRILLVFGGNWCMDCHVLDNAFHQPTIAPLLNSNFVVVHVDIGRYDKNLDVAKQYHVDLEKGVPSIAVLNSDGSFLYSTAEFEKARVLSEEDVLQFLNKWKPQPATAKK
jgi:thiol:disulfide interchange protein